MALPRANRLSLRFERESLKQNGLSFRGHFFTLIKNTSSVENPRFAILVSRKTSSLSVDRNKIRRLTTEALRSFLPAVPSADYLLIPQRQVLQAKFEDLVLDLRRLLIPQ